MNYLKVKTPHDITHLVPCSVVVDNDTTLEVAEIDDEYTLITPDDIIEHVSIEEACASLLAYVITITSPHHIVGIKGEHWNLDAEVTHAVTVGFIRYDPHHDVAHLRDTLRTQCVQPLYHLNTLPPEAPLEDWVAARLLTHQLIMPYDPLDDTAWRDDNTAYRNAEVQRDPDTHTLMGRTHPLTLNPFGFLWTESDDVIYVPLLSDNITIPTVYTTETSITDSRDQANAYSYRIRCQNYHRWMTDQPSPYAILDTDSLGSLFKRLPQTEDDPYLIALYAMVYKNAYEEGLSRKDLMVILRDDYPRYADAIFDHPSLRILARSYAVDPSPLNRSVPIRQVEWVSIGPLSAIVNTEQGWTDYLTHVAGKSGKRIPALPADLDFPVIVTVNIADRDALHADAIPLSSVTTALRTVGL